MHWRWNFEEAFYSFRARNFIVTNKYARNIIENVQSFNVSFPAFYTRVFEKNVQSFNLSWDSAWKMTPSDTSLNSSCLKIQLNSLLCWPNVCKFNMLKLQSGHAIWSECGGMFCADWNIIISMGKKNIATSLSIGNCDA